VTRVLLACYEVPGWGGAATASYRLLRCLRERGLDVSYLTLVAPEDQDFFALLFGPEAANPAGLDGVHSLVYRERMSAPQPELAGLVRELDPDVVLSVGDAAVYLLGRAAPDRPIAFLASGFRAMDHGVRERRVRDLQEQTARLHGGGPPPPLYATEAEAVERAALVITHAPPVLELARALFPGYRGKIHPRVVWYAEWIHADARDFAALARPWEDRDVDVLFVANSWERPVKNWPLVEQMGRRLPRLRLHVVGEVPRRARGLVHHGMLTDRRAVFELMGRARVVASPSVFDAAPGVLFEAATLGCNVVASRNCGNWTLCHESLVADPLTPGVFAERLRHAVAAPVESRLGEFLASGSLTDLVETLEVLA
jgi:glycosyltransferase involved in cell wall biosynthesis